MSHIPRDGAIVFDCRYERSWNLTDETIGQAPAEQLTLEFQTTQRKKMEPSVLDWPFGLKPPANGGSLGSLTIGVLTRGKTRDRTNTFHFPAAASHPADHAVLQCRECRLNPVTPERINGKKVLEKGKIEKGRGRVPRNRPKALNPCKQPPFITMQLQYVGYAFM